MSFGEGLELLGMLIAATSIGQGQLLSTLKSKRFSVIPGLTTVHPYVR